jgi:hypothetical protein
MSCRGKKLIDHCVALHLREGGENKDEQRAYDHKMKGRGKMEYSYRITKNEKFPVNKMKRYQKR